MHDVGDGLKGDLRPVERAAARGGARGQRLRAALLFLLGAFALFFSQPGSLKTSAIFDFSASLIRLFLG